MVSTRTVPCPGCYTVHFIFRDLAVPMTLEVYWNSVAPFENIMQMK